MNIITLKRGPNLELHLTVVQYIKGVGPQRAKALIRGETVNIELEEPSREVVIRNLRKLAADGALIVEGLLGMTESNSSAETTTVGAVNPANDLAEALARVLSSAVNEDKVKSIVDRQINEALSGIATTRIELTREDQEPVIIEGLHHPMFTRLLKMVTCRAANGYVPNIWIAGEKSSGKSHAGRAVAQALKLPFYVMGTLAMAHEAIGFVDANGKYHSTPFVDAFVGGGVLQMDEIDSYEAHPTLCLNGPLANNYMTLPDGRFVERHRDCIIIGGANTWGMGATNEYIGRNKLDAAFLSRFPAKLTWNIDPALEQAFCGNVRFAERVQRARARAKSAGLKLGIDTRHTAAGAAFIAGGFTEDEAADMTYLAGLSDEQRKIVEGV
jgi:hypothetical protein